jgi:GntR family transcriptional regulator
MYRQIAEDLRQKIAAGTLQPGSQLPTELELREMYQNASRNTVRDAVKSLVNRGLVVTKPGQGTFVVDRIVPFYNTMSEDPTTGFGGGEGTAYEAEAIAHARTPTATVPRVEIQLAAASSAGDVISRKLQLPPDASVVSRHQQLAIDEKPWSLQTSFYPYSFVTNGAPRLVEAVDIKPGTVKYLSETLDLHQVGYQDEISARPPNDGEKAFFRLPDTAISMIETIRTAYDQSGHPMRCTVTVWPADRNRLVYNVGKLPFPTE